MTGEYFSLPNVYVILPKRGNINKLQSTYFGKMHGLFFTYKKGRARHHLSKIMGGTVHLGKPIKRSLILYNEIFI